MLAVRFCVTNFISGIIYQRRIVIASFARKYKIGIAITRTTIPIASKIVEKFADSAPMQAATVVAPSSANV